MKQLFLFKNNVSNHVIKSYRVPTWYVYVDGADRNNPGPAGAGVYLLKNNVPMLKDGFYLASKTNNQAEYFSLLLGLFFLEQYRNTDETVRIISDSELLVRQLKGIYKVKKPHLKPLFALAHKKIKAMNADITHVLRAENKVADKMANLGIDEKKPLPDDFITFLSDHQIRL